MRPVVFLGPSLPVEEARALLDADYRQPAAQGDVLLAARDEPSAIGIVDGYFERVPAVWHKEILWALSRGIPVFGASSMGALRAAELAAYGMVGVGQIFDAYREGRLHDDDEVAVAHAGADYGYAPGSEAMVNIRATLGAARAAGVIGEASRARLESVAKDLYYPLRSYPRVLRDAHEAGGDAAELQALAAWLPQGQVNAKRRDALALLATMRDALRDRRWQAPAFEFQRTIFWERAQLGPSR
jgi:hypothetical protein